MENCPSAKMVWPAIRNAAPSAAPRSPMAPSCWPTLPTRRPTLGSLPATAHLKRGPLATARPTRSAAASLDAPVTETRITCWVPSPFRTSCCARSRHTSRRAASKAPASPHSTRRLHRRATVSLVDSSPSTDTALKLHATALRSISWSSWGPQGRSASVRTYPSMVAMLGSIMPAPFAKATMRAPPGNSWDTTFGYRSVVQMPSAPGTADSACKLWTAAGTAAFISSTGRRQPMTPVEHGSTAPAPPARPRASATAPHTASLAASPSPPGQTLDTLLLTTIACRGFLSASRRRPTRTGQPGNALEVNTSA
mmetsp:Transcript_38510/g.103230  ORF Transcript_38510/g.103230 Transcript_38510/m.103230 type:complete len:310 (-) Transcript_38510:215-1144(-)